MKTLLTEIHRRSLWQVAVIYLVGAAAVYWAIGALTEAVGVPTWTPVMAFFLLLVALPFTIAAAFVRDARDDANALTGLVAELHRRSLWQVMGIFLAGSWGALQVVEVLTETAGLPDWMPTMALVLLLVGLPVCLATAFVQEGLPGVSDTADEVASSPKPHGAVGLLTWRNVLIGAVGGFAALGLSTGSYVLMWSMGIGPVGNLVAQGVITEGQRVVLADFRDGTGEGYAAPITEALRIDLLGASIFDVVDVAEILPALSLMQLQPGADLTPERAHDVAARLGVAAVLEGELTSLGTGYVLTATLTAAEGGRSLAGFRVTAKGPDELIQATDRLSQDIREKSGESLRTIRAGHPLERATTASMEALRLYTEGVEAINELADQERGELLLEQALAQDSTFAMAWRQRGLAGGDPARRQQAIANAYRYRDKVPDLERFVIEGLYFTMVNLDMREAIEAYEKALLIDPEEPRAVNNLSFRYAGREEWDRAHELLLGAVARAGVPGAVFLNLIHVQIFLQDLEGARGTLEEFEERLPGNAWSGRVAAAISFAEGDLVEAVRQARVRMDDPAQPLLERAWSGRLLGRALAWSGRLDEARTARLRSDSLARQLEPSPGWESRIETAYDEALLGDDDWARSYVAAALGEEFAALPASGRHHFRTAMTLAIVGDPEAGARVIRDWHESTREDWQGPTFRTQVERARLQARVARGEVPQVSEEMRRLLENEGCSDACWLFDRALLHEGIGDYERAAALYERVGGDVYRMRSSAHGNTVEILHARLRLGALYEQMGDTARAIPAYQRVVDQWVDADSKGLETVFAFQGRIAELSR